MAAHTQKGSVTVDAFQWLGGTLNTSSVVLPVWAKQLALHSPGDGCLQVPTGSRGTGRVNPTDWVVQVAPGSIEILTNVEFTALYN